MAIWRTEAMPHAVWKPNAEGVMLYVPLEDTANATRMRLSRLSVSEEPESCKYFCPVLRFCVLELEY